MEKEQVKQHLHDRGYPKTKKGLYWYLSERMDLKVDTFGHMKWSELLELMNNR